MIHQTQVENYNGNLTDLAEEIGNLRYDALADFLDLLSKKIRKDGEKDENRGRVKLATQLFSATDSLEKSKENIDEAWRISEPYM